MSFLEYCEILWSHFFPKDKFHKQDARIHPIELFEQAFERHPELWKFQSPWERKFVTFRLEDLRQYLNFHDFDIALINRPCEVLGSLNIAISIAVHKNMIESKRISMSGQNISIVPIYIRITNIGDSISYSEIKSSKVGQLVSLTGYVIKISSIRPLVQYAKFVCGKCLTSQSCYQEDGIFNPPASCSTPQCRNKYLELQRHGVVTVPFQRIKIQETDDNVDENARVPRSFDLEMRGDLVNQCRTGDLITVVGIVSTAQIDIQRVTKGVIKEGGLHQLYIHVNSITEHRRDQSENAESSYDDHDKLSIYRSISNHQFSLALLCMSLCPTIYGHELVKAGLLLGLVGGTSTARSSDLGVSHVGVSLRSDIHILVVGDPGLGKSQLLRACAAVAARGIFVCGNTSSAAGLTVTIGHDGRDTSIEAGALVLADQGICCIDELDKLSCDHHALLEAMEQQRISIAKGGVVTSLKSRASIIAAANPVNGHYQRKKSLCENLKMPSALISRFDIVFLLLDRPDETHDRRLSEHIMRSQHLSSSKASRMFSNEVKVNQLADEDNSRTFSQRLRYQCGQLHSQTIPQALMRDYIEYARKSVHPILTADAAKILQRMYLTLRSQASLGRTIPVTTRNLESLIRLAQARAKIELRDQVTAEDANDVVDLLHEALLDAATNEVGEVELGRKGGMGLAKQIKAIVKMLTNEAEIKNSKIFTLAELTEIVRRMKIDRDMDNIIEIMRTECYLLYKGPRLYQLQT